MSPLEEVNTFQGAVDATNYPIVLRYREEAQELREGGSNDSALPSKVKRFRDPVGGQEEDERNIFEKRLSQQEKLAISQINFEDIKKIKIPERTGKIQRTDTGTFINQVQKDKFTEESKSLIKSFGPSSNKFFNIAP